MIMTLSRLTPTAMPTDEPFLKPPGSGDGIGVGV
jgi:hypothetical protein